MKFGSKSDLEAIKKAIAQEVPSEEMPLGDIMVTGKAKFAWKLSSKDGSHSLTIWSPERTVADGTEIKDYPIIKQDITTLLNMKNAVANL